MTFYKCEHCGNIIAHIQDSGVRCHCCGEEMKPLVPNTSDGAGEKHVPVVQVDGQTVTVTVGKCGASHAGSSFHPVDPTGNKRRTPAQSPESRR